MANTPALDDVQLSDDEGAAPIADGLPLDHLADVALSRHDTLRSQDATQEQEVECPQVMKNAFNDMRQRGSYTKFKYMQMSVTISSLSRDLSPQHWDAACAFVDSFVSQGKISRERGGRRANLHFQAVWRIWMPNPTVLAKLITQHLSIGPETKLHVRVKEL
jgi:hypothetical protein